MGILCRYLICFPYHLRSLDRALVFLQRVAGSQPVSQPCHHAYHMFYFYHVRPIIFEKTIIKKLPCFNMSVQRESNTGPPTLKAWCNVHLVVRYCDTVSFAMIKQVYDFEFWWVFYSYNIFLVDLYYEMLGPGVNVGSYPFPFGIKFSLVSIRKPIFGVARDQASIPGVIRVLSSKKLWKFFVCKWKFSEKHTFFFNRLKRLLVVQIPENTVYQENAEHVRLVIFHWQSETVEIGGTCLGEQKSIQSKVVFNPWKLYYYAEDTFTRNCIQGFSDIRRNEKVLL